MRSPSIKRLCAAFRDLDASGARLVKRLCALADEPVALRALIESDPRLAATARYARSCYSSPWRSGMWRRTMVLHAINGLVGTHGVEALDPCDGAWRAAPPVEYLNAGDPYTTTLLYRHASDNLYLGCWGNTHEASR